MSGATQQGLSRIGRQSWSQAIIRWLLGTMFLFAAFTEFPDHKWSIGLGLLVLWAGIAAVGMAIQVQTAALDHYFDGAERKTRHTILLAAERVGEGPIDTYGFWGDVDFRVSLEADEPEPVGFWKATGLVVWNVVSGLFVDLAGVALVAALTS